MPRKPVNGKPFRMIPPTAPNSRKASDDRQYNSRRG